MAHKASAGKPAAYDTPSHDILGTSRYCALLWPSKSVVEPPLVHSW